MNLKSLKGQVEYVLKNYKETRNSDIELTIKIWKTFYKEKIVMDSDRNEFVAIKSLFILPREDNIKRVRAKFQNEEGIYLPTSLEVVRKRNINERKWRIFMGYATGNPEQETLI